MRARNLKGIKLGGCLRKQELGKYANTPSLGVLGTREVLSQDVPHPQHLWVCRGTVFVWLLRPLRSNALDPKPYIPKNQLNF